MSNNGWEWEVALETGPAQTFKGTSWPVCGLAITLLCKVFTQWELSKILQIVNKNKLDLLYMSPCPYSLQRAVK
jgi:hypothetical protein